MRLRRRCFTLLVYALVAVGGVSFSARSQEGPAKEELLNKIKGSVPGFEIIDFEVEASQNTGTIVEPVILSRVRSSGKVRFDRYEKIADVGNRAVVRLLVSAGTEEIVYWIVTSRLLQGSWSIEFRSQGSPLHQKGQQIEVFGAGVVVEDSKEHKARLAEIEALRVSSRAKSTSSKIYKYKGRGPIYCTNPECQISTIELSENYVKVTRTKTPGHPKDLVQFEIWHGDVRSFINQNIFLENWHSYEVWADDPDFYRAYKESVRSWRSKYCSIVTAFVCGEADSSFR